MTPRLHASRWNLDAVALLLLLTGGVSTIAAQDAPPAGGPPYRVGGKVTRPEKISGAAPVYTELARRAQVTGTVILEAIIDEQGNVESAKVLKGLPMGLDKRAVEAVETWKLKPATLEGKPVKVYWVLTVNFQMQIDPSFGPRLRRFLKENPEFAEYMLARRYREADTFLYRHTLERPEEPGLRIAQCYSLLAQGQWANALGVARSYPGPDSYEMFYLVGAFARERAVVSPDQRAGLIDLGLEAETMAIEVRREGMEAMIYKALLLRDKAKLALNPAERQALENEAAQLEQKTKTWEAAGPNR
ncbi:MAG: energy transducer TonB [Thermoanaerobaculia bacterium]